MSDPPDDEPVIAPEAPDSPEARSVDEDIERARRARVIWQRIAEAMARTKTS